MIVGLYVYLKAAFIFITRMAAGLPADAVYATGRDVLGSGGLAAEPLLWD
ncbi:hypothetical protein ACODNH_00330 (plasmid) [Haloarcula sp. NS06]